MPRVKTGVKKGPRMISEIQRLKGMGIGKTKIAAALGISKNTVRKYLRVEIPLQTNNDESLKSSPKRSTYHAPWSNRIDWSKVRFDINRGVQLKHHWEDEHVCRLQTLWFHFVFQSTLLCKGYTHRTAK